MILLLTRTARPSGADRVRARGAWCSLLPLLLVVAAEARVIEAASAPPGAHGQDLEQPDPTTLMRRAREILIRDLRAWQDVSFTRSVERRRLDQAQQVIWRTSYRFDVVAEAGGFTENLLEIEGRAPTAREKKQHLRAGRFAKHYRQVIEGAEGAELDGLGALAFLFHLSSFRYDGTEIVLGRPCHRIAILPTPQEKRASPLERVASATEGAIWLTRDSLHIARLETGLVRPISRGPVRVLAMQFEARAQSVGDLWLPERLEVRSDLRFAWQRRRIHNTYVYSDMKPSGAARRSDGEPSRPLLPSGE